MLPQNILSWHIEYFRLKKFEKTKAEKSLSYFPLSFSPEVYHKTFMWELSLYTQRKGKFSSPRQGCTENNPNEQALLNFSQFQHLVCTFCHIVSFHNFPLLIKPSTKIHRLNHFGRVFISLWRILYHVKIY